MQSPGVDWNWRGRMVMFALAYFLAARIGLAFFVPSKGFAVIWPASGVALAALLLSERRQWLILPQM